MRAIRNILLIFIAAVNLLGCRERFFADYDMPATGYLVVSGNINNGTGPTEIRLARSTTLSDNPQEVMEKGATVFIETNQNDRYALQETSDGVYRSTSLILDNSKQYRVIITAKGKQYQSDYTSVQLTPDIDSVTWKRTNGGVQFFANAHDDSNNSKYYQWKYEETWETSTPFISNIEYVYDGLTVIGVKYRFPDRSPLKGITQCWATLTSSQLLLGSTEKLTRDNMVGPVQYIPPGSQKLSLLYSIMVKQYKLSQRAYNYFTLMKKNTEQLGTVFDPQPSLVRGNITCVSDPKEPVVGFVEVVQEKQKRFFLRNTDVPGWFVETNCNRTEHLTDKDSLLAKQPSDMPSTPAIITPDDVIVSFYTAPSGCIDCRRSGSTNVKPDFWP